MKFLWLILLILPWHAWSSPAEDPEERSLALRVLDRAHAMVGNNVNLLANRLDSFFANQRADDELGRSVIRVRNINQFRDREESDTRNEFRLNLRLPNLEDRFKLKWFQSDKKEPLNPEERKARELEISNVSKLETKWMFRADAGVNVAIPPVVFTRARLRKNTETGEFIHRFVEELAWFSNQDGLYNRISLDSDYTVSDDVLFRFINFKEWRITSKNFVTSHGPTLLQKLSEKDGISYSFIVSSTIAEGTWFMANYGPSIGYRRNVYRNWLFMDVNPGLDFPKNYSFRRTPYLIVRLEALFGGIQ
jgi:hypothetical protein